MLVRACVHAPPPTFAHVRAGLAANRRRNWRPEKMKKEGRGDPPSSPWERGIGLVGGGHGAWHTLVVLRLYVVYT